MKTFIPQSFWNLESGYTYDAFICYLVPTKQKNKKELLKMLTATVTALNSLKFTRTFDPNDCIPGQGIIYNIKYNNFLIYI